MWGTVIRAPFLFLAALHYFPMKITRRISAFALLTGLFYFSIASGTTDKKATSGKYLAFVGTYTTKTESKGIYAFEFDADTGKLAPKGIAAETGDPSWVAIPPSGKYAYAANEAGKASTVSAFSIDKKSGKLTQLNHMPSLGEDPCYLSFDKTGKFLFVANYSSGTVAVFPVLADGRLGEHTALVKDQGATGPNKERQEAPHAHWIGVTPGNFFVLVADLGLDKIMMYRFDASNGSLVPHEPAFATVEPGAGPRHVAIHPSGRFVYTVSELKSTVTVFSSAAQKKNQPYLVLKQQVSMLPKDFSRRNDAAEIAVHPNGKFLYASNRGHDSIAVFEINEAKGTLTAVADVPTGGKEPRHFAIDPTGKYLLAENQFSNNIVVFKMDPSTGGLTPTGQVIQVPSPVDVTFVAAE
jgi:6-phosphogluconolactonase